MPNPETPLDWQALADFIGRKLKERGWDEADLARESGISSPTIWRILNAKPYQVRLQTFVALAEALDTDLWRLLEVAGYPIERPSPPAEADLRFAHRLARHLESFPELKPVVEWIFDLDESDRRAVLAFLTILRRDERGDQK